MKTPHPSPTGQWRLSRVELVNWGTFSGAVCFAIAGLVQARFVVADVGTTTA